MGRSIRESDSAEKDRGMKEEEFWKYENWPSGEPYQWEPAGRGSTKYDLMDYHVDLGCGTIKKGRIGIDRFVAPGVNIAMDLNISYNGELRPVLMPERPGDDATVTTFQSGLPFPDSSIESIISHHFFEHVGDGFVDLIDECYRVLKPGGILRAITPLFPSRTAVEDPDHKRYFMEGSWESFCGTPGPGGSWYESFSVPYMNARFTMLHKETTPPLPIEKQWGPEDAREIRVALQANK
jgi:SAM-dependent methyltransferase